MILDEKLRRPSQVLVYHYKFSFYYLVKSINQNCFFLYKNKNKKKINLKYKDSFVFKIENLNFGEIDKIGKNLIIRSIDGKIINRYKISKKNYNIKSVIYDTDETVISLFDAKYNQVIKVNISNPARITIKYLSFKTKDINFQYSKFYKLSNKNFIVTNKTEVYLTDNNLKKIKKINKKGRNGPYSFRKITSTTEIDKKYIICDSLNYKIKFYDKKFRFEKSYGGKGIELGKFDLPTFVDNCNNKLFICDMNNDRILSLSNQKFSNIIKTKYKKSLLRRPIKILSVQNFICVLDRDNSRVIFYNKNLKILKILKIKKFKNGKPNSIGIINFNKK